MQVDSPGIYPLLYKRCPNCDGTGQMPTGYGPDMGKPCMGICHGTGRIPDENGAKVEIKYRDHRALGWQRWGWYWRYTKGSNQRWMGRSGPVDEPFPTPAEAFADAQEAYRAGR